MGGAHRSVVVDDHDVHAAELFEIATGDVVEEADLVAALGRGLLLRQQRGGVVATGLGEAGAAAPGAVVALRDPDADGRQAAGEVGARGRGDDVVVHDVRGAHPQEGRRGEGEGAQVEGFALTGGDPLGVGAHQVHQGGDEVLLGKLGQRQATGGDIEPGRVVAGPEGPDTAVSVPVGLDPLEDLLPVVQDGGGGGHREVPVGRDLVIGPAHAARPAGVRHVVGEDAPEVEVGQGLRALRVTDGAEAGGQREATGEVIGGGNGDGCGTSQGRLEGAGRGSGGRGLRHSRSLQPRS